MFKHSWSILCDDISISEGDGRLNIIGVMQHIGIKNEIPKDQRNNKPLRLPLKMRVISMWHLEDLDAPESKNTSFYMRIRYPNGSYLDEGCPAMKLKPEPWQRTNVGIENLAITGSGTYYFEMLLKSNDEEWKLVAEIPVSVNVIDAVQ